MAMRLVGNVRYFLLLLVCGTLLMVACPTASAQVAPLAPRWLAGTPPPPVETFADGLARHHIDLTETALIAALADPDGEVRSLAAAQLAAMDDHPALTAILDALDAEPDPQVQVNLAGAATWLGSNRALDRLQRLCQNLNVPSTTRLDAARYVSNKELPTCFSAVEQIERGSGQIQNVFSKMNPLMQFLFVVGYGIAQPVLPPAFFAPTTMTWHIIAVFRAIGWYIILPLLIYAPVAAWRSMPGRERRLWLWFSGFSWLWILTCAIRAGGDQWDNPRYRLIFFGFEALAAGYGWLWWRTHRDAWLPRIFALEILCVLLFGQWYVARYYLIGIHLPILVVLGLSVIFLVVILPGGWLWDRWQAKKVGA